MAGVWQKHLVRVIFSRQGNERRDGNKLPGSHDGGISINISLCQDYSDTKLLKTASSAVKWQENKGGNRAFQGWGNRSQGNVELWAEITWKFHGHSVVTSCEFSKPDAKGFARLLEYGSTYSRWRSVMVQLCLVLWLWRSVNLPNN